MHALRDYLIGKPRRYHNLGLYFKTFQALIVYGIRTRQFAEKLAAADSKITLKTHPYVHAYLKKGLPNIQMRWFLNYGRWIRIVANHDFQLTEYKFYDENDDEIRLGEG